MKQFRISDESFKKYRKKWLSITIPIVVIISLIFVISSAVSSSRTGDDTWMYYVGIFPVIYGISIYRGIKKQQRFMMSYCITITDNEITREQISTPPLTISFMEIKEIIKYKKGNYSIKGATRADVIHIPYLIDDKAGLEQQLQLLAPITVHGKDPWQVKYRWGLVVLVLGTFISFFVVDNKIATLVLGIALLAFIGYAIYFIFTSKNVPATAKRRSWVYLLLVALIIYTMYTKITGRLLFI